jgi:hypothetical protein
MFDVNFFGLTRMVPIVLPKRLCWPSNAPICLTDCCWATMRTMARSLSSMNFARSFQPGKKYRVALISLKPLPQ